MRIWLLTLMIFTVVTAGVDLMRNYPIPFDDSSRLRRAFIVLVTAAFLSAPTALAVALGGR